MAVGAAMPAWSPVSPPGCPHFPRLGQRLASPLKQLRYLISHYRLVNMSLDAERFVIAVPPKPQLQQLTVFDRQGKILNKVGEPGVLVQPHLSPDGKRIASGSKVKELFGEGVHAAR